MKLVIHVEGKTRLIVPSVSLEMDPPPTSPVFFNPAASLNRDISVAVATATKGSTFCDSMAGVGARGLRIAKEVGRMNRVTFVDFNKEALGIARRSSVLNKIRRKCEFSLSETSSYLFSRYRGEGRFDYIDVDPFGTPVGQLQGALCATSDGGLLSVTATDTAVLCGVHPKVAVRRYGAIPLNNHFGHENAIRLLAGSVARMAASLDIGVQPVVVHSTRHYLRLYVRVGAGASKADAALENLGYIAWCRSCGHTDASKEGRGTCGNCGVKAKVAGPLWVGALTDQDLVRAAKKAASQVGLLLAADVLGAHSGVDGFPPWCFSIERICSSLRVATVSELDVYQNLLASGQKAMRTPFEKTGIKTRATFAEVVEAVKASARPSGEGKHVKARLNT